MSEPTHADAATPVRRRPLARALQLVTLASFALAQPLFAVIQENATFLVAARVTRADLWLFALATALVPGLALALVVLLAARLSDRLGDVLHLVCVGVLAALVVLPPLRNLLDPAGAWTLLPSAALGLAAAWAHRRWTGVGSFLDVLAPAPLVFALLFLFGSAAGRATRPLEHAALEGAHTGGGPSAVFVVFDELPLQSLFDPELGIDAQLFPGFARLAATSTWMRNATASHENTERALPAIFTGQDPDDPDLLPTAADHPRSVFTLLGASHRMRVRESLTSVCPDALVDRPAAAPAASDGGARRAALFRDAAVVLGHVLLPEDLALRSLPAIDRTWGGFGGTEQPASPGPTAGAAPDKAEAGTTELDLAALDAAARRERPAQMREFIAGIDGAEEPTLYLLHVLLPHGPYVHLPSGATYDTTGLASGFPGGRMPEWPPIAEQQLSRHLLQLVALDGLLGELLDRLEETGLFERCALLVLADHGVNFTPGEYARQVFKRNAREIAHVPFFVKRPGQRQGGVDDRDVRTVDALPTLLEAMGIETTWTFDGVSALAESVPARGPKLVHRHEREPLELDPALPRTWRGLETRTRLFGARPLLRDLYSPGAAREFIGVALTGLERREPNWTARLDHPERFRTVPAGGASPPVVVAGRLDTASAAPVPDLVLVAVDGVIRGTAACRPLESGRARFTGLVPEDVWTAGEHEVRLYVARGNGLLLELGP